MSSSTHFNSQGNSYHDFNVQGDSKIEVPAKSTGKVASLVGKYENLEAKTLDPKIKEVASKRLLPEIKRPPSSKISASSEIEQTEVETKIDSVSNKIISTLLEELKAKGQISISKETQKKDLLERLNEEGKREIAEYFEHCDEELAHFANNIKSEVSESKPIITMDDAFAEWEKASKNFDDLLQDQGKITTLKDKVSNQFEHPTSDKTSELAKKNLSSEPLKKGEEKVSNPDKPLSRRAVAPLGLDLEEIDVTEINVTAKNVLVGSSSALHESTPKQTQQDNKEFQLFANLLKRLDSHSLEKKLIQKDNSIESLKLADREDFVEAKKSRMQTLKNWLAKIGLRDSVSPQEAQSSKESQKALETIFTKINFQIFLGKSTYLDEKGIEQNLHKLASDFLDTAYAQNEIKHSSRLGSLVGSYFLARINHNSDYEGDKTSLRYQALNSRYQALNRQFQALIQPTYQGEEVLKFINQVIKENEKYKLIDNKCYELLNQGDVDKCIDLKNSFSHLLILSEFKKDYAKSLDVFIAKNVESPVKVNERPLPKNLILFPKIAERVELPEVVPDKVEIQTAVQVPILSTKAISKVALPVIETPQVTKKQKAEVVFENKVVDLVNLPKRKSAGKSEGAVKAKELSDHELFSQFEESVSKLKKVSDESEKTWWNRLSEFSRAFIGPKKEVEDALVVILSKAHASINEGNNKYINPINGDEKNLTKLIELFLETDYAQNIATYSSKLKTLMELHKFQMNQDILKDMSSIQAFDKNIFNKYDTQYKKLVKNFNIKEANDFIKQINNETLRIEFRKKMQEQLKILPPDSQEITEYMHLITVESFDVKEAALFTSKMQSLQLKAQLEADIEKTIFAFRGKGNSNAFKEISYDPMKNIEIAKNAEKLPEDIKKLLQATDVFTGNNMEKINKYFTDLESNNSMTEGHQIIKNGINRLKNSYLTELSVLNELYVTEKVYQDDLGILRDYFKTLQTEQLLSKEEASSYIGSLEKMISTGSIFLSRLEKINDKNTTINEKLEAYYLAFLPQHINSYLESYATFVPKMDYLIKKFDEIKKNPKGQAINNLFINEPKHKQLDPPSFLIKPVQRMVKYPLLMREMNKNIPSSDSNSTSLMAVDENSINFEKYCKAINEIGREKGTKKTQET